MEQTEKINEITDKLEQGIKDLFESKKYENYLKVMSKFHNYSFNNSLLIAMQKPDATMVAGYTSWNKNFKRNVNKGEKGIKILAPSPYKVNKDVEKIDPVTQKPVIGKNGEPVKERVQVTVPAYKVTTVFDISQTSGEELPEIVTQLSGDVKEYEKFLEAIKQTSPVPIEFKEITNGSNGYYHLEDKSIAIREGMSQMQTIKTAIHEVSHAMLHDRDNGLEKDTLPDRKTKEVEAESIAYTVCQHYGIDTSDYSFGYVAGWSSGKDLDELKNSMNIIRSTASEIIKGIDANMALIEKEEKINELATAIDDFVKGYDPYNYADTVDSQEDSISEIRDSIVTGKIDHIEKWLQDVIDDCEIKELRDEAVELKEKLQTVAGRKKESEDVKQISHDKEMVVEKHHRKHR